MIRILIVDDSAFMRTALTRLLQQDPQIEVVGTARDGFEAITMNRTTRPDVITMDVEMPRMNGIAAVRSIMKERPCPILMVSSLTQEGALTTLEALQAGAADFVTKENALSFAASQETAHVILSKIKTIYHSRHRIIRLATSAPARQPFRPLPDVRLPQNGILVIGISTGGPQALQEVIPKLPASFALPILIVQHMPPTFTTSLANRLNTQSELTVVEAAEGNEVQKGWVYVAPGGRQLVARRIRSRVVLSIPEEPTSVVHRPSANITFESVSKAYGAGAVGLVMTGMGNDGLEGGRKIKEHGARNRAQDEDSCVVYGMPRAIVQAGLADAILPLSNIATALIQFCKAPISV